MLKYSFKQWHLLGIVAILVFADQLTKYIIKSSMYIGESFSVLGDFFRITYVENPGMAFGVSFNNTYLFLALSIFAALMVFYYLLRLRKDNSFLQLALCFISAGAVGNLWDRFTQGKVVDFLDFEFWDISISSFSVFGIEFSGYSMTRWPVFNVADMAVSGGMIILISYLIFVGDPFHEKSKEVVDNNAG